MKKRITAFVLFLSIIMASVSALDLNTSAASTLTISRPSNDEHVSKSDPPKLKWNTVSGASGYRVTVVNVDTEKDLVRNYWTTNTSYSLESLFDDTIGTNEYPLLKIWVGAMASIDDNPGLTSLSSDIIYIKACEAPEITVASASIITAYGANFYVTVNKNYGSAIIDSGFYIGTSSDIEDAKKYSAKRYSEQGVISSGTMILKINSLEPDTKYYFWGYAENGVDETVSSRQSFTTKAVEGSLSVSTASVDWDDGADNSQTVNVSYTGSYSYSVEYEVPSGVIGGGYNYEWLSVTQSGSSLILKPNRANFSKNDRTAYVTVTSNGKSKEIVVTQERCSESAPTLQLWRETQSNILNDGALFGSFDLPQNAIEVDIISKNIRKVYAQLLSSDGSLLGESTSLTKLSFNTSSLGAGTYSIKVFASNSETGNDYWSQRPFDSMTVYFTLKKAGSLITVTNPDFTNISCAKDYGSSEFPNISDDPFEENNPWTKKGTIVYVQQNLNGLGKFYPSIWENANAGIGACTRASTSSALSYLNLPTNNVIPKAIGNTIYLKTDNEELNKEYGLTYNSTCGCVDTWGYCYNAPYRQHIENIGCSLQTLHFCKKELTVENFVKYYNRYANDTAGRYSPLVLYTNYWVPSAKDPHKSMHTLLIVGHDANENDVFYVLDPGNTSQLVKIRLTVVDGQIRIKEKTSEGITGKWNTNAYNVNYTLCQIWQIVNESVPDSHTHSYTTKNYAEHPHNEYKICDCGDIIETGNTLKVTGCNECYPAPEICPHLWAGYEKDETNHWVSCSLCHELIFKAPHIWNEGKITKPATESETGIIVYTCTECTKTKDEVIPTTSHVHNWSTAYTSDDTHHWYTCSGCSDKKDVIVHLWDWGNVTKPATESETGIRTYTCAKCNRTKDEIIPVTGHTHNWSSDYNFNETHHWFICTGCDEKNDVVAHLWSSGTITKPATESEAGVISYSCAFCGYIKEEIIPKLESSTPKNDVNNDGDLDQTDAEAILQYITGQDVEVNEEAIDVNNDGTVNIRDAAMILLYLNGKIDSFN